MCDYLLLAQRTDGMILWCEACQVYNLQYNTIMMTLDSQGFDYFKNNMAACYHEQLACLKCPNYKIRRDIMFQTKEDGMRLCFSVKDIALILSMMQEAALVHYGMKYG